MEQGMVFVMNDVEIEVDEFVAYIWRWKYGQLIGRTPRCTWIVCKIRRLDKAAIQIQVKTPFARQILITGVALAFVNPAQISGVNLAREYMVSVHLHAPTACMLRSSLYIDRLPLVYSPGGIYRHRSSSCLWCPLPFRCLILTAG